MPLTVCPAPGAQEAMVGCHCPGPRPRSPLCTRARGAWPSLPRQAQGPAMPCEDDNAQPRWPLPC